MINIFLSRIIALFLIKIKTVIKVIRRTAVTSNPATIEKQLSFYDNDKNEKMYIFDNQDMFLTLVRSKKDDRATINILI